MTIAADKTKINFVVTIRMYNALFAEAQRTGLKISELIRQGIELRLAPPKPSQRSTKP